VEKISSKTVSLNVFGTLGFPLSKVSYTVWNLMEFSRPFTFVNHSTTKIR